MTLHPRPLPASPASVCAPKTALALKIFDMEVIWRTASDIGQARRSMQDSVEGLALVGSDAALLLVADGMGGAPAGDVASQLAVEAARRSVESRGASAVAADEDLSDLLQEAVHAANDAVWSRATSEPDTRGMGTTLVLAIVRPGRAAIANVGDSRAYLLRQGSLDQITVDHSYVAEAVRAGRLSPEEARTHSHRNIITRVVGTQDAVEGDISLIAFDEGDTLLLCTDGLHGPLDDAAITAVLADSGLADAGLDGAERLIAAANQAGGPDNIAVALARVSA